MGSAGRVDGLGGPIDGLSVFSFFNSLTHAGICPPLFILIYLDVLAEADLLPASKKTFLPGQNCYCSSVSFPFYFFNS